MPHSLVADDNQPNKHKANYHGIYCSIHQALGVCDHSQGLMESSALLPALLLPALEVRGLPVRNGAGWSFSVEYRQEEGNK